MLLRFQKPAVRENCETGNQAFSMRLRFLTTRGLAAADYIDFTLYYEDTNDPHRLVYEFRNCAHGLDAKAHRSIKRTLTERELGPFPSDYNMLFPSEFRKIETRMKSRGGKF